MHFILVALAWLARHIGLEILLGWLFSPAHLRHYWYEIVGPLIFALIGLAFPQAKRWFEESKRRHHEEEERKKDAETRRKIAIIDAQRRLEQERHQAILERQQQAELARQQRQQLKLQARTARRNGMFPRWLELTVAFVGPTALAVIGVYWEAAALVFVPAATIAGAIIATRQHPPRNP